MSVRDAAWFLSGVIVGMILLIVRLAIAGVFRDVKRAKAEAAREQEA